MSTIKKKQHYVWQRYLRSWAEKGKIYCYRQDDKKLFGTSTGSIANETFFHQIDRLSETDLVYVEKLISRANRPELRELHNRTVVLVQSIFMLEKQFASVPMTTEQRANFKNDINVAKKTFMEEYYTQMEGRSAFIFSELLNMKCEFFSSPESATEFIHFITHQFFRTPMIRNINASLKNKIPGLDLNRCGSLRVTSMQLMLEQGFLLRGTLISLYF
jgi:hypothetical protein